MEKHRHHRQPQHFLKGFSVPSKNQYQKTPDIWVYRKGQPFAAGNNPELCSVRDVGYERDFYAYKREDKSSDYNKYEDILMSEFEQPGQPVLDKIRARREINSEEQNVFSKYIGSMITRGLWWKGVRNTALSEAVEELSAELLSSIPEKEMESSIQKIIAEQSKEIGESEWKNIGMIRSANDISAILNDMVWHFVVARKGMYFFTSDNPVFYFTLDEGDGKLMFPLSSDIAPALSWRSDPHPRWTKIRDRYWEADDRTVEHARNIVCSTAHQEVYCSRRAEWIVDFFNSKDSK